MVYLTYGRSFIRRSGKALRRYGSVMWLARATSWKRLVSVQLRTELRESDAADIAAEILEMIADLTQSFMLA